MNFTMAIAKRSTIRSILFLFVALPVVYTFVAIQYASITVPFWDHTELIHWIAAWYDGNFSYSSLLEPHNHSRPLVYRFIMVFNAALTDWDIRSEYVYMYLVLFATFGCHVWILRQLISPAMQSIIYLVALLLISLVFFSPSGHNNHWWSMMFQLNATNLFVTYSFLMVFIRPKRLTNHVLAALSCWLAVFTLTNGLFAVITIGLVFQLSTKQMLRLNRWTLFWVGNLTALLILYLPGLALSTNPARPTLLQLAQFSLAYLGAPLGGLLLFQYRNMFDIPVSIVVNAACGAFAVTTAVLLCWQSRNKLREQNAAAMILYGFTIFAVMSAIATGWGRAAFDEYGIANGNSSRYTIFGAYIMLGQIYYLAVRIANGSWNNALSSVKLQRYIAVVLVAFVFLSFVSYGRAINVYADAHRFSKKLFEAYPWGLHPTIQDQSIHPDPKSVYRLKSDLQRLELGPYNGRQFYSQALPVGEFKKAGLLSGKRQFTLSFTAAEDGLKAVAVTLVTPNGMNTSGSIEWQVTDVAAAQPVARGILDAARIKDWETVRLKLPYLNTSKSREYLLTLTSAADDGRGAGVALYAPLINFKPALQVTEQNGTKIIENLSFGIRLDYTK